jgi:hypothetical protein
MGWYPNTEVYRGSRAVVEAAFAVAKRFEAGGHSEDGDEDGADHGDVDHGLQQILASPGSCVIEETGRKNTVKTSLLDKVEEMVHEGKRGVESVRVDGSPEGEEIWLYVPHAALAAVLAAHASPPPALTEAAALAKLIPQLARVSQLFDKNIASGTPYDRSSSDEERSRYYPREPECDRWRGRPRLARRPPPRHPLVLRQRDAFRNSSGCTRPMSLADRVARMQLDFDALYKMEIDFQHTEVLGGVSDDDSGEERTAREEREAMEMEGRRLLHARIALQNALDDANAWLDEVTGKSVSPLSALHTLLREADAAGQDVLVHHYVS